MTRCKRNVLCIPYLKIGASFLIIKRLENDNSGWEPNCFVVVVFFGVWVFLFVCFVFLVKTYILQSRKMSQQMCPKQGRYLWGFVQQCCVSQSVCNTLSSHSNSCHFKLLGLFDTAINSHKMRIGNFCGGKGRKISAESMICISTNKSVNTFKVFFICKVSIGTTPIRMTA